MPRRSLDKILQGRRSQPHQLIEVLQDIQKDHGHISRTDMQAVSETLGVPVMEVYRVASFYKAFRLRPAGKTVLTMCMGTACHVRSARLLLDQAMAELGTAAGEATQDGLVSYERVNCLGACAVGPVVKENDSYHHHMTPAKLRKLIQTIRLNGDGGK